jgi:DNA-binding response OmpR family regulator
MPKILIVDDDPQIVKMLARFFKAAEYTVETAEDGLVGIEIAKKFVPDVVVADVAMPNLDGKALCAMLKKDARTGKIPFLYLSGDDHIGQVEDALKEGGDGYIRKPFDLKRLMEKVEQLIHRARFPEGGPR